MDSAELTMEEKCENLMAIVVESRKNFGKMCVDYEQKTALMENKMLNLQLETISNYHFKPKHSVPIIDVDEINNDIENFTLEVIEKQKRFEELQRRLKVTREVVLQLNKDSLNNKAQQPLTAAVLMARAKDKINNC